MTILMISIIMLKNFTSTNVSASSFIHSGVIIGAIIVVIAVTVTDKREVRPRQVGHDVRGQPARAGSDQDDARRNLRLGNGIPWSSANPTSGITEKWQTMPTSTPRGDFAMPAKSFRLICVPMPNITVCTTSRMSHLLAQVEIAPFQEGLRIDHRAPSPPR